MVERTQPPPRDLGDFETRFPTEHCRNPSGRENSTTVERSRQCRTAHLPTIPGQPADVVEQASSRPSDLGTGCDSAEHPNQESSATAATKGVELSLPLSRDLEAVAVTVAGISIKGFPRSRPYTCREDRETEFAETASGRLRPAPTRAHLEPRAVNATRPRPCTKTPCKYPRRSAIVNIALCRVYFCPIISSRFVKSVCIITPAFITFCNYMYSCDPAQSDLCVHEHRHNRAAFVQRSPRAANYIL